MGAASFFLAAVSQKKDIVDSGTDRSNGNDFSAPEN
jgi:hypothetical protein